MIGLIGFNDKGKTMCGTPASPHAWTTWFTNKFLMGFNVWGNGVHRYK